MQKRNETKRDEIDTSHKTNIQKAHVLYKLL